MADIILPGNKPLIGSKKAQAAPIEDATTKAARKNQEIINKIYEEQSRKTNEIIAAYNDLRDAVNQHSKFIDALNDSLQTTGIHAGLALLLATARKSGNDIEPSAELAQAIQVNIKNYITRLGPEMQKFMSKEAEKLEKEIEKTIEEDKKDKK